MSSAESARRASGAARIGAALLCGALLATLSGCVGLVVGSAVTAGFAATDRRTLGAQTEDQAIMVKAEIRIPNVVGSAGHVNITSFNRKVLLSGEVRDEALRATVEREIGAIAGVQSIVDEIEIAPPSGYAARSNDALLTTKVRASLIDRRDISVNSFKVVSERGVVYLMGRVTQREGQIAADIARGVGGVQKVVKLFEYISEDELKQMETQPAPAAPPPVN